MRILQLHRGFKLDKAAPLNRVQPHRHPRRQCTCRQASSSPVSDAPAEASSSSVQELQRRLSQRHNTRDSLRDPANIGAKVTHEVSTKDWGGEVSLARFMALPVEQYYELDPAMIRPLQGNRFALVVPRVHIFNVWVEPLVETEVLTSAHEIIIQARNCRIFGSDLVERLGLDRRFCIEFTTRLTWTSGSARLPGSSAPSPPRQNSFLPSLPFGWGGGSEEDASLGRVKGESELQVYSEVIGPFQIMPRSVLQAGGSAVMSALVRTLLPLFMRRLADDYQRWATDSAYRKRRGQNSQVH